MNITYNIADSISKTTHTCVKIYNGIPTLFINDKPHYLAAYMTYLNEHARYNDFNEAGYEIFTFTAYFTGRGINVNSGTGFFRRGIFDKEDTDDFSVFDDDIYQILKYNPNAYIFSRISLDNHNYLAIYSSFTFQKTIKIPEKRKEIEIFDDDIKKNFIDEISIYMEEYQTRIFKII